RRLTVRSAWQTAPIIRVLTARDIKVKYKQSLLGQAWVVIQPAALLAAFVVAFRGRVNIVSDDVPYVVFALVGLAVWSYFQAALTAGTASVVSNLQLTKKSACPRIAYPVSAILAATPSLAFTAVAALVAAAIAGRVSWPI